MFSGWTKGGHQVNCRFNSSIWRSLPLILCLRNKELQHQFASSLILKAFWLICTCQHHTTKENLFCGCSCNPLALKCPSLEGQTYLSFPIWWRPSFVICAPDKNYRFICSMIYYFHSCIWNLASRTFCPFNPILLISLVHYCVFKIPLLGFCLVLWILWTMSRI